MEGMGYMILDLNEQNYTMRLMKATVDGFIEQKISRGAVKRKDGFLEDAVGQVLALDINQGTEDLGDGEVMHVIRVKVKPITIAQF